MCKSVAQGKLSDVCSEAAQTWRQMGCNRKRLAALLMASPLDKMKDEEVLFNKAAKPCQATISPQQLPEMGERERKGERRPSGRRGGAKWQKNERKESDCMEKKANRTWERWRGVCNRGKSTRGPRHRCGELVQILSHDYPCGSMFSCSNRSLWKIRLQWFHFKSWYDNWRERQQGSALFQFPKLSETLQGLVLVLPP